MPSRPSGTGSATVSGQCRTISYYLYFACSRNAKANLTSLHSLRYLHCVRASLLRLSRVVSPRARSARNAVGGRAQCQWSLETTVDADGLAARSAFVCVRVFYGLTTVNTVLQLLRRTYPTSTYFYRDLPFDFDVRAEGSRAASRHASRQPRGVCPSPSPDPIPVSGVGAATMRRGDQRPAQAPRSPRQPAPHRARIL